MLVFASPVPSAFARLGALQPRHVERPSAEEQYFQTLAEEHERAAALARQRLNEARRRQHQQHELEAQLRLQQELATALHVRTPQRSPYHTPARSFGRALPCASDVIFEFGDNDACDAYAERMHRRSQLATIERQKRAEQQNMLRALFEEQRRAQAERVAQLHRQRAEQAKAEQERHRKAQEEQARRHLAARAADEEKLRQFFQALVGEMGAASEAQGADLERKNALRRSSVPVPPKEAPVPAPATRSAPASPAAAPTLVERSASPAPSVASDASDASLNSIALLQDKYNSLRSSFTFPSTLSFAAPSRSTPGSSPTLLYNPTNAPVHAYENALTNLLTELDAVESFGDAHVRDVRRSLVKNVEAELEALEEKKREAWRQQAGEVESPVESAPLPVEVAVESTPVETAPAVESAPVESAPVELEPVVLVTEDESTESTESPNPVSWLATRLSQPSESEDDEVKAVRENLLARLTETATEPAVGLVTETETVTEAAPTEPEPEPEPTVQETESAPELPTSPDAVESPTQPETVPAESASEPAVESSPVESAPEPEAADAHTSDLVTEAPSTEAPVTTTEAPVTEAPAIVATEPETTATEPETTATESESITTEPETIASEPEVPLTTPVEFTPESDASSITSSDEPEVITQHEAQSESEVESPVLAEPEPESAALAPAQSEPAPAQSEPSSAPAPTHEHSTFVQVFPDSDSDADTDADLASELADRKSINGDEFELL